MTARCLTFGMSDLSEHHMLLLSSAMRIIQSHNPERLRRVANGGDITFVSMDSAIGRSLGETQCKRQRLFVPIIKAGQAVPNGVDYFLRYPFKTAHVVALITKAKGRVTQASVPQQEYQVRSTRKNLKTQGRLGERILHSRRIGTESWTAGPIGTLQIDWKSKVIRSDRDIPTCAALAKSVHDTGRAFYDCSESECAPPFTLPLAEFLWELGLASAQDKFMEDHLNTHALRLVRWPDFGVIPGARTHMRVFSLLGKKPVFLDSLARNAQMDSTQIAQIVSACTMSGLIEAQALPEKKQPCTATPPVPAPGFLSRIRRALGITDGTANA